MLCQTGSRGIRSRNQALTHLGGEQGREAVLDCLMPGATACGLLLATPAGGPNVTAPKKAKQRHVT
jgi:hypothetical protein